MISWAKIICEYLYGVPKIVVQLWTIAKSPMRKQVENVEWQLLI